MRNALSLNCIIVTAVTIGACSSVPEVENRLQSMQLHSNMYVVQAGETVQSIAYRYRLSPEELVALNPGLKQSIVAGLRINVRPGTVLSPEIRARAKADYGAVRQPQIVDRASTQIRPQQSVLANDAAPSNEVIIESVAVNPEIVPQRVPQVIQEQVPTEQIITEIPATSWSDQPIVAQNSFNEEIIPDTLDYEPVQADRSAMNAELEQYLGEWTWPTNGQVAREFAPSEVGGQGVDIAGVPGQDINAAMTGTVVYSGRDLSGGGNLIIVRHSDNLMTTYSHADQLYVAEDDQVAAGDPIASLGSNAGVSVLRFEVRKDGNPLDPMKFLPLR